MYARAVIGGLWIPTHTVALLTLPSPIPLRVHFKGLDLWAFFFFFMEVQSWMWVLQLQPGEIHTHTHTQYNWVPHTVINYAHTHNGRRLWPLLIWKLQSFFFFNSVGNQQNEEHASVSRKCLNSNHMCGDFTVSWWSSGAKYEVWHFSYLCQHVLEVKVCVSAHVTTFCMRFNVQKHEWKEFWGTNLWIF